MVEHDFPVFSLNALRIALGFWDLAICPHSCKVGSMKAKSKSFNAPSTGGKASNSPPGSWERILVAMDFSDPSRESLQRAVELAQMCGAELSLVYVVEPTPSFSGTEGVVLMKSDAEMMGVASNKLEEMAAELLPPGIKCTVKVLAGRAHKEIVDFAKKTRADLIVLATHGYTGLKHTLLGSTAEAVVRYAPCAVLVTRKSA